MTEGPSQSASDAEPAGTPPGEPHDEGSRERRPAFYAARAGGWRDWWTLLHPPYTAWHLAYVVIGACLAPTINVTRLVATLFAFFFAVGLAAHSLDELNGRPLGTHIPSWALVSATVGGLAAAVALGSAGVSRVGWTLIPFLVLGPLLVVAYNFELFGGVIHNDAGFALAWGSFPVLVAYVAQTNQLAISPLIAAAGAFALSAAQRQLSTRARLIRRRSTAVRGQITLASGQVLPIDAQMLLAPVERALLAMSWAIILIATSLAVARLS